MIDVESHLIEIYLVLNIYESFHLIYTCICTCVFTFVCVIIYAKNPCDRTTWSLFFLEVRPHGIHLGSFFF